MPQVDSVIDQARNQRRQHQQIDAPDEDESRPRLARPALEPHQTKWIKRQGIEHRHANGKGLRVQLIGQDKQHYISGDGQQKKDEKPIPSLQKNVVAYAHRLSNRYRPALQKILIVCLVYGLAGAHGQPIGT